MATKETRIASLDSELKLLYYSYAELKADMKRQKASLMKEQENQTGEASTRCIKVHELQGIQVQMMKDVATKETRIKCLECELKSQSAAYGELKAEIGQLKAS